MELDLGTGTDVMKSVGIYITGDTAVLKPGSTSRKIMLYKMPDAADSTNAFLDKATIFLSGLLSDDGGAFTMDKNVSDRLELCDRFLDPGWTTRPEDYKVVQITMRWPAKMSRCVRNADMSGRKPMIRARQFGGPSGDAHLKAGRAAGA